MVEELIKHLQVVRMVSCCLKLRVLEVLAKELIPLRVSEILGHFIEYFLFFKCGVNVLLGTLLYLQCIELLI